MSGQDESNPALWLATPAGNKMELSCPFGTTRCVPQEKFHQKPCNKSFINQACSVKIAGHWPRSFSASLWTSTASQSINTQKRITNLANIQPSWPHTWSITHTSYVLWIEKKLHHLCKIMFHISALFCFLFPALSSMQGTILQTNKRAIRRDEST